MASCVNASQDQAPPAEKIAWGLFVKGEKQRALDYAVDCVKNPAADNAGCSVLLGVISVDEGEHQAALSRFDAGRAAIVSRQKGGSAWDHFLLKSLLKNEGVAYYKLDQFDKAAASLARFDDLRDRSEMAFDIYAELLSMSMYRKGDIQGAAAYLQRYVDGRATGEAFCWVTYNLSAMHAKRSMTAQSVDAARRHVNKCNKEQFAKDVKEDSDFANVRDKPEFGALVAK